MNKTITLNPMGDNIYLAICKEVASGKSVAEIQTMIDKRPPLSQDQSLFCSALLELSKTFNALDARIKALESKSAT